MFCVRAQRFLQGERFGIGRGRAAGSLRLLLRDFSDDRLRREHHTRDGTRVLHARAGDLLRVENALINQVTVLASHGVVTKVEFAIHDVLHNHITFRASVVADESARSQKRLLNDFRAQAFLGVSEGRLEFVDHLAQVHQSGATTRDDAFLDRGKSGVLGIFNTKLAFF